MGILEKLTGKKPIEQPRRVKLNRNSTIKYTPGTNG